LSVCLDQWAYEHDVVLHFITPGKPTENAFIESFNGKFRDECMNQNWFINLEDAKGKIDLWRWDYNHQRPHSALKNQTPVEFAAAALGQQGEDGRDTISLTKAVGLTEWVDQSMGAGHRECLALHQPPFCAQQATSPSRSDTALERARTRSARPPKK
jgi:oligoribonuclease NrnB/cAMP/cGMP phosphodiesterase (DHH superfamily)